MSGAVRFVDTTLRDGQQSLWALGMRLDMVAPLLADLDSAGFDGAEYLVPTTQFVRSVKQLGEDPWPWVRLGPERVRSTPLRITGGGRSYFSAVPACVEELLLVRLSDLGYSTTRISDPWNDFSTMSADLDRFARHGFRVVLNVIYTVSPRHTVDYYRQRVRDAVALAPFRICFKDVGGLLTPEVAREILPMVVAEARDIPVEFHAHCNNGFAPYCALVAAESGIRVLHAAIPPLANGSSQPSIVTLASNLRARGFDVDIDLAPVERISRHLESVATESKLPRGAPLEYDEALYRHQTPGGMISNLRLHLGQVGMADQLDATLLEAARVRADLGYPVMVTPLSQYVGAQAALNVMSGERYTVVTDEVIGYALGRWGREALEVIDPEVRARILASPRAREIAAAIDRPHEEPSLEEVRSRYGSSTSDEELVLRVLTGASGEEIARLRRTPPPADYEAYRRTYHPLIRLVERVLASGDLDSFEYRDGSSELVLERGGTASGRQL